MTNTELFLNIVQNHHHVGSLHSSDYKNFCLMGALYVANDMFDFENGDIKDWADVSNIAKTKLYIALEKAVKDFDSKFVDIAHFNDYDGVSHEDIMLVAKKAVAECEANQ